MPHLEPATHEHRASARVYGYEADYQLADDAITWEATVRHADEAPQHWRGEIRRTTPALGVVAEEAVRDAIVRRIDAIGTAAPPGTPPRATPP